jgi:hypothetical protein
MNAGHVFTATRYWLHDLRRRPLLLLLLVVTPVFFITRAIAKTEPIPRRIGLAGGGSVLTTMRDIHGASMAAITVAFLGGLVGVFIIQSARQADQRLVLAGYRATEAVTSRLVVLFSATSIAIVVSLVVTARDFSPHQWGWFVFGTAAIGYIYAMLGALAGALLGRVGATYLILIGSMLDIGVVQNPMFGTGTPPGWAVVLPGFAGSRIINTSAFSHAAAPVASDVIVTAGLVVGLTAVVIAVLSATLQLRARSPK